MIDLGREQATTDTDQAATDTDRLLREIVAMTTIPQVGPGDITVAMFAEVAGIPQKTARSRLDALVRDGIMKMSEGKRRNEDNRPVCVWRKVQE